MYCQKCGKQIDDGSAFCQYCGVHTGNFVSNNSVNEKVYQNYNVQHTERKTEHIKSKEEFMADYRAKHPEIIVYFVLFAIFKSSQRRKFKWYVNFCLFLCGCFCFSLCKKQK